MNKHMSTAFAHSLDPHSDSFPKSLAERLSFAHFQREDLTAGQRCERCVRAKRLGDACMKTKPQLNLGAGTFALTYTQFKWTTSTMASRGG